jgi:urease accessory protein
MMAIAHERQTETRFALMVDVCMKSQKNKIRTLSRRVGDEVKKRSLPNRQKPKAGKMTTAQLLEQRSFGQVKLQVGTAGIERLREQGASKLRMPRGANTAYLINTGGGIAGGDAFQFEISCAAKSSLTVTSQAAERVYKTLGPPATLTTVLRAASDAKLYWLPQETILFDGAALQRNYSVFLAPTAKFLAVEPIVFGRTEMNEKIRTLSIQDRWRITQNGKLFHAEDFRIDSQLPRSKATLGNALASATFIYIAEDAERHIDAVRSLIGSNGGASAWNGKLVARVLAKDGFHLRKTLIPVLNALAELDALPKNWTA